jgi:hypothetical protein
VVTFFERQHRADHIRAWTRVSSDELECSHTAGPLFQTLLLSWNCHEFPNSPLSISISFKNDDQSWSPELKVAEWGQDHHYGFKTSQEAASVDVDVISTKTPKNSFKVFIRGDRVARLLRRLSVAFKVPRLEDSRECGLKSSVELGIPERSQRSIPGGHSHRLCSPTAVSMVLQSLGLSCDPRQVAEEVYDQGQRVYGNWSFNVSYAGCLGFDATALWLENLTCIEDLVCHGMPVIVSQRFKAGELPESPLEQSPGHLLVVRGFTDAGDVIVNDPAADPAKGESVRRVYPRLAFAKSWSGLCYLIQAQSH